MKRPVILIASIVCVVGGLAFAQQPPPAAPGAPAAPPKINVLIVTGQSPGSGVHKVFRAENTVDYYDREPT